MNSIKIIICIGTISALIPPAIADNLHCRAICVDKYDQADLRNACVYGCKTTPTRDLVASITGKQSESDAAKDSPEEDPKPNGCGSGTPSTEECPTPVSSVSWVKVFEAIAENDCLAKGECAFFLNDDQEFEIRENVLTGELNRKSLRIEADNGALAIPNDSTLDHTGITFINETK